MVQNHLEGPLTRLNAHKKHSLSPLTGSGFEVHVYVILDHDADEFTRASATLA